MRRALRDPAAPSLLLFAGLVLTGFVAMGLGWRVVARTLNVYDQVPAVVSGGLGGLVLVVAGVVLLGVQTGRRTAAVERVATEGLLDEAAALLEAVQSDRTRR